MTDAHLSDERLAELGCGRSGTPMNGEKAHLDACPACARRLGDERRLSALLAQIENAPPAASFAARARSRYEREVRAGARRRALVLLACLAAAVAVWALLAWAGSDALAVDLAKTVAACAAVFRALSALIAASPFGFAVCVALVAASLIGACGALAALIGGPVNARASSGARVKEV